MQRVPATIMTRPRPGEVRGSKPKRSRRRADSARIWCPTGQTRLQVTNVWCRRYTLADVAAIIGSLDTAPSARLTDDRKSFGATDRCRLRCIQENLPDATPGISSLDCGWLCGGATAGFSAGPSTRSVNEQSGRLQTPAHRDAGSACQNRSGGSAPIGPWPAELLALNICILFKSDFGSWTKANGRRRIERGRQAAGPCAEKFCGDNSFRKLDRPRSDQAQTQSHILRSSFERPRPMSQARSRVASGHSQSRTIEADLNKRGRYDRPISGAMLPALWRR